MLFILDLKNIQGKGPLHVKGLKVDHVIEATLGDKVKYGAREVSMGVNYGYAAALSYIIYCHIGNEGRFTRARFSYDVGMLSSIGSFNAKNGFFILKFGLCEEVDVRFLI